VVQKSVELSQAPSGKSVNKAPWKISCSLLALVFLSWKWFL
jgi:hypothetical protein